MYSTIKAKEVTDALISFYGTIEAFARHLDINSAHVHKLIKQGNLTPTLEAALVERGLIEPKPTRVRTAFNSTVEMQQWAASERERRGIDSQQLLIDMRGAYEWVMTTAQDVLMRKTSIDCGEATWRRFREAAARHGMTGEEYLLALMEEDRKS